MKKQKNQFCMSSAVHRMAKPRWPSPLAFVLVILATSSFITAQPLTRPVPAEAKQQAQQILKACNVKGGLIVHVGCGDGRLTTALHANDRYLVHGLDRSDSRVAQARQYIQSLGVYGAVSVERWQGGSLPYIDNLVNLVVSEELGTVPMSEVMRVLCPNGVAYIRNNGPPPRLASGDAGAGKWVKTVKPRPKEIDDWTHYLHDASNNAVSHDTVVGPPRRMQWVGSPRYARHHDRMSSVNAVVSDGGRIFYIFDEGSRVSILLGPKWSLIARDAFNGTVLWKRRIGKWHTHLWPLKSGPAQLPRRLVAADDCVYVTLSLDAPLMAIDAATGKTIRTYEATKATEEVIISDGVLFLLVPAPAAEAGLVNKDADEPQFANLKRIRNASRGKFWDEYSSTTAGASFASIATRARSSGNPSRLPEPRKSARSICQRWLCTGMWSSSQEEKQQASRVVGTPAAMTP